MPDFAVDAQGQLLRSRLLLGRVFQPVRSDQYGAGMAQVRNSRRAMARPNKDASVDLAAAYLDAVMELEDPAAFEGIGECNAEV